MSLRVAPAGHDAALYAVKHWHYSKSLPVPPCVVLGVWEHDKFIGCVIYSRGASSALGRPYGLAQGEICELTRVALAKHDAPVTQIVSASLAYLQRENQGLRLCVSFADPAHGHHGGIYQAGNWIYAGQTSPSVTYFDATGRQWHNRQVSANGQRTQFGNVRKVPKISTLRAVKIPGKHRYLLPLDRAMRRRVAKLAQPYPEAASCGRGLDSEPPEHRSGSAGAPPAVRSMAEGA